MRGRTKWGALAIAVLTVVLAAGPAPAAGNGRSVLRQDLDAIRDAGAVGVQARVVSPAGRFAGASGTAVLGRRVPVPVDGHFRIGSNTKTFVAVVLLQLEAEGRLSLVDSVQKWLPGLVQGNGNDGNKISIRQLLQHTSGLHDYPHQVEQELTTEQGFRAHRFLRLPPEEVVARGVRHPPVFAPGSTWGYANVNYVLAGMIVEQVTGQSWRSEVRRRIIEPLGLRHTSLPDSSPRLPRPHAEGYTKDTATGNLFRSTEISLGWVGAAAEIVSTTEDLGRFWRALLGGGLLPPTQLAKMKTTVPVGRPGYEFGLGMARQRLGCGTWVWSHAGGTSGFLTGNAVTEDGRTSVIVSRSLDGGTRAEDAAADRLVEHAICGK
ncbi:serine hydrolase domain-containing protein [Crossiella cryophila]|uniref:D-alanyl-D-alanine carboxypeptidase n=1 Tax=Crossiella cryophila TaxID=43355 RepID=A0A7W7CFA8_9PSEU|nr:serine hydrolase domain-containing protein [Crossiella cryophila]MBB4678469.1 D-alanyl-D-alanine carboxypeptidase [Crossiella cryophila]